MADKFPSLDSIDKDVPPTGSTEDLEGSDFLSREKELLGNEFETENDKETLEESDDGINDFKEQFPEVEDSDEPETKEVKTEDDESAEPSTSKSADSQGESKHIKQWRERRDLEISEREKANSKKKKDIVSKAEQTIDDFYDNYNNKKEQHSKDVLKEQEQFLEKRDGFLKSGTLWDRVHELVDDVGEVPNESNRDKTRFKGLLGKLKGKESVPGAGGY